MTKRMMDLRRGAVGVLMVLVVSGCASVTPAAPSPTAVPASTTTAVEAPTRAPTLAPATAVPPATAPATADTPVATVSSDSAGATATTPEQNLAALFSSFTTAPTARGEVLLLTGRVLDVNGNPVPGAAVEIWHTDAQGIYDHPDDRSTNNRDRGFQFYGTSITDQDGNYAFRTILPGQYEPRPRHIHVKVKMNGSELLTTQFYFEEDRQALRQEGIFAQAGNQGDMLILNQVDNPTGVSGRVLANDLVVDTGIGSGTLQLTPAQTQGPYYPRANVADFDNDLAVVP